MQLQAPYSHDYTWYIYNKEFFQGFKNGRLPLIQTEYFIGLVVVNQILVMMIGQKNDNSSKSNFPIPDFCCLRCDVGTEVEWLLSDDKELVLDKGKLLIICFVVKSFCKCVEKIKLFFIKCSAFRSPAFIATGHYFVKRILDLVIFLANRRGPSANLDTKLHPDLG